MTKTDATAPILPALAALGGWMNAEWFCPTLLSDADITGFTLPKLSGLRKQSFHILDRAKWGAPPSRTGKPADPPSRPAGKLQTVLASFGATAMVACSQVKLLFETGPILFFGEFPATKVKQRSANKMRRELIALGVRGCVLRVETKSVIFMFWYSAATGVTDFVNAALPDYELHRDFELAVAAGPRGSPQPVSSSASRAEKRATDRETRLLQEIVELRQQIDALKKGQSPLAAMEQLGLDDTRLKSMLKLLHPDKHANSPEATDAAKWLNNLRDLLKGKSAQG